MYPPPPPPPQSAYYKQSYHRSSSSCTRGTTIVMASILLFGHACMWLSCTYFLFALFGPLTVFLFNYQTAAVILTTVGIVGAARRNTGCLIAFIIHLVFALIGCVITFIGAILAVTIYAYDVEERIEIFYRRRSLEWNANWFVPAMIITMILMFFSFVYNAALLFFAISTRNEIVDELRGNPRQSSISRSRRPSTSRQQYPIAPPTSQSARAPKAPKSPKSPRPYPKSPETQTHPTVVASSVRSQSDEAE